MNTAVLFLIFNRPHLTSRVFEVIREAQPAKLFIMADGPRPGVEEDVQKCREARKVLERVDWPCDVKTLFFDQNRGCGCAVTEGINWFFDNVEQGIILEDDCLPDKSFFWFCGDLLNYYKNESKVMHINGNNFNTGKFSPSTASYHFGSYPQAWGWATWKRAWECYDFDITRWPEIKEKKLLKNMNWHWYEKIIQKKKYDDLHDSRRKGTWDYQWHLTVFLLNGLTIVPKVNLVSNIGFGSDATHTTNYIKSCTELEITSINFPLEHPGILAPDKIIDKVYREIIIGTPNTLYRMMRNRARSTLDKIFG